MLNYFQSGIQYVNGLESAKMYQTQPNQSVLLMDSNEDKFYIVRADASNFKSVEQFSFKKIEEKKTSYVTQEQFDDLLNKLKPLLEE